jgi:adenylyltransferase/sulfurtransferase
MASDPRAARYSRQVLFPPIGAEGQERILASTVAIVGCGALGASLAEMMARAGAGRLRLIDRDIVEESNLGRQALYTAEDAAEHRPKAAALARHLAAFNPTIALDPRVADLNPTTAPDLLDGVDLILDGTDNFEARYLLNDFAVRQGIPWIYGACVGARGLSAVILPGETPCLRCLFPEPPPPGSAETCDTAGIIGPAATLVAALQVAEALKILCGKRGEARRTLVSVELWPFRVLELGGDAPAPDPQCPACAKREFAFLEGGARPRSYVYCGRQAVQIVPAAGRDRLDLDALQRRLSPQFACARNEYVLRVDVPPYALTIFDDGRALISGTGDAERARSIYDRYVGS